MFVALGWSANLAVKNIKYLGAVLRVRLFVFGILLGLITSLPELFLGINAIIDQAAVLSVGNLLGGVVFKLGLILGVSLLVHRKIATDGRLATLIPMVLVIFSPILFGIDGKYSLLDGLVMVGLYVGLIFYLYRLNHFGICSNIEIGDSNKVGKAIFFAIAGIIGILVASHWIIEITLGLLVYFPVSQMVVGLIVFAIGTNLPEASIAIVSWRKKSAELSLSNLLSSSFTNVLVLGSLALFSPIVFSVTLTYWATALFLGFMLVLLTYFYYTGKKMDRHEGAILLAGYILFVVVSIFFSLFNK